MLEQQGQKYFSVKVSIEIPVDDGKTKKKTELYIVPAVSITDAEAKMNKYYKDTTYEFIITSVVETKIVDILE